MKNNTKNKLSQLNTINKESNRLLNKLKYNLTLKRKRLHLISFYQFKVKLKRDRFVYQYYLKLNQSRLTIFFNNISKTKTKNSYYLSSIIGNILYFVPSLKLKRLTKLLRVFVNRQQVHSDLFMLFKIWYYWVFIE